MMKRPFLMLIVLACALSAHGQFSVCKIDIIGKDTVKWSRDNDKNVVCDAQVYYHKPVKYKRVYFLRNMSNITYGLRRFKYLKKYLRKTPYIDAMIVSVLDRISTRTLETLAKGGEEDVFSISCRIGKSGKVYDAYIFFLHGYGNILTTEEVYSILHYLQKEKKFPKPTEFDIPEVWFQLEIRPKTVADYLQNRGKTTFMK